MHVHLTVIEPAGRPWQDWLNWPAPIPDPTLADFFADKHYEEPGQHLLLIHGSDPEERESHRLLYESGDLAAYRGRVWFLYYSGAGYSIKNDWRGHSHCLNYPIGDDMGEAHKKCFRNALALLADDAQSVPAEHLWQSLYPPNNVTAVTLLMLMQAALTTDVDAHFEALLADAANPDSELGNAYSEYCRAAALFGTAAPWSLQKVRQHLELGDYRPVSEEFARSLGRVPD